MSIVYGGCGLPCLSRPLFNHLTNGKYTGIFEYAKSSDLCDMAQLKFIVKKVSACTCIHQMLLDNENEHKMKGIDILSVIYIYNK